MTAMDFSRARDRVRGMVSQRKRQSELSRSSLTPDPLRDNIIAEESAESDRFKGALRNTPTIEYDVTTTNDDGTETVERKQFDWSAWPEMLRDVARASFGYDEPELIHPNAMRPSHRLNREIMAEILGSEAFSEARPYTRGNGLESLFNALAVQKSLRESAPTRLAEHIQRASELEQAERDADSAQDMLDRLREQAQQLKQAGQEIPDALRNDIKGAVDAKRAAQAQIDTLAQQQAQSNMVLDAAAAAQDAAQAGQEAIEALSNLPGIGGGESQTMTPDQQIALAERWADNPSLQRIAMMLGRMYRDMRFKRETRTKNVPIEPVGITTGNEITRVLPMELARAFSPNRLIKATFYKDYAQSSLLQTDMSGKMPAGKGPIICVTDGSGSMGGDNIVWAQSLALCLLTIAQREHRDFAGIQFSGGGTFRTWEFPAKQAVNPDTVLDYAGHFFGGGTSTVTGMREAARIISDVPGFSTADIILIGDGQDRFGDADLEIRNDLRAKDVRIHGISILCPNNVYLEQMCEYVVDVTDLAGSNDATDRIARNLT